MKLITLIVLALILTACGHQENVATPTTPVEWHKPGSVVTTSSCPSPLIKVAIDMAANCGCLDQNTNVVSQCTYTTTQY